MSSRIYLLRHGQSQANVTGLVASNRTNAAAAFGLTSLGRDQVRASVGAAMAAGELPPGCPIVCSPLLRAVQSAQEAAAILGGDVRVDDRLIERAFGSLELGPADAYEGVWSEDREDPGHERWGVESTRAILERGASLLRELAEGPNATVLSTHGDVASVLFCASLGLPLGRHREVGPLANGELRLLAHGLPPARPA
ncbi:MAG: histidine phosphatase family protein [Proteobacteria bacterium]|nr:histidine phosphatase family protein [Pseudomonadota bacterium]